MRRFKSGKLAEFVEHQVRSSRLHCLVADSDDQSLVVTTNSTINVKTLQRQLATGRSIESFNSKQSRLISSTDRWCHPLDRFAGALFPAITARRGAPRCTRRRPQNENAFLICEIIQFEQFSIHFLFDFAMITPFFLNLCILQNDPLKSDCS